MVLSRMKLQGRRVLLSELAVTRSPQLPCRHEAKQSSLISEALSHSSQGTEPLYMPTWELRALAPLL